MSDPILIDAEIALRTLDECVKERGPDYKYRAVAGGSRAKQCLYWHPDNTPGCIVGLALYKLGVPKEHLVRWNHCAIGLALKDMNATGITNSTLLAELIFQAAQVDQDNGAPWGEAVAHARRNYENNDLREFTE